MRHPKPTVWIWSDTSPWPGGVVGDIGLSFQHKWSDWEQKAHIKLLELRAVRQCLHELESLGNVVSHHIHHESGGYPLPSSNCVEPQVVARSHPQEHHDTPSTVVVFRRQCGSWLPQQTLLRWDFKLVSSEFQRVCQWLQVWPTPDAFASKMSRQVSRYMTWEDDHRVVAVNALDYEWDPVTWLFPWSLSFPQFWRGFRNNRLRRFWSVWGGREQSGDLNWSSWGQKWLQFGWREQITASGIHGRDWGISPTWIPGMPST